MTIAIKYPAGLYYFGPFPSVPGMSRPRTVYVATPAPACPVIIADTPDAARKLDAALDDCANAARNNAGAPPAIWIDAAQWLTNREIRHAAAMAGCEIIEPAAPDDDAAPDPARERAKLEAKINAAHDKLEALEQERRFDEADAFLAANRFLFNYDRKGNWIGAVANENGWTP